MLRRLLLTTALLIPILSRAAAPVTVPVDLQHSRIDVAVHATVDSFVGVLSTYQASLEIDAAARRITGASLSFKFADLKTGKADRDAKMLTWEEDARFPDASFAVTSLSRTGPDTWEAKGIMTLHGVSHPLTFPVAITTDHQTYSVDGKARLDTRDFGLPIIRLMLMLKVDPLVVVHFHLQASAG